MCNYVVARGRSWQITDWMGICWSLKPTAGAPLLWNPDKTSEKERGDVLREAKRTEKTIFPLKAVRSDDPLLLFWFYFFLPPREHSVGKRYATTLSNQPSAGILSLPTMRSHNSWVPELSSYRGKIIIKNPVYQENLKSLWYLHSVALNPAVGPQPLLRVWCQSADIILKGQLSKGEAR